MANGSKLIHTQNATFGRLPDILCFELLGWNPNASADKALMIPKAVSGAMIVLMSLNVKSQTVFTWYTKDLLTDRTFIGGAGECDIGASIVCFG